MLSAMIGGNIGNCVTFSIATILLAKFPPGASGNVAAGWGFIVVTWLYNFSFSATNGPLSCKRSLDTLRLVVVALTHGRDCAGRDFRYQDSLQGSQYRHNDELRFQHDDRPSYSNCP